MRLKFASAAFWIFAIGYLGLFITVIGFGEGGGWQFAFDLMTLAGLAWIIWEWWKKKREEGVF